MRNKDEDVKKLAKAFFAYLTIDSYEFGGIGLDSKRPFGNSSPGDDILEIIGWEPVLCKHGEKIYSEEQEEYADGLYRKYLIPFLKDLGRKL